MSGEVLRVENLRGYLEAQSELRPILNGVNLRIAEHEATALLGESGSGKTFLALSLLGLHAGLPGVVSGTARIMGVDVMAGLSPWIRCGEMDGRPVIAKDPLRWSREIQRRLKPVLGRDVCLVPQDPFTTLPPFYNVGELLGKALRHGHEALSRAQVRRAATTWLERVHMYGVDEVLTRYPHELSGGMAQRVVLALALAPRPRLLIADEPTTGLDATLRVRMLELLMEAVHTLGVTLFLITHDTEAARMLARRVAVLCAGRIVEEGPVEQVLDPGFEPKHPYTEYLLAAEASLAGRRPAPPATSNPALQDGVGCGYRFRCPAAEEVCGERTPPLCSIAAGPGVHEHRLACWKATP